MNTGPRSKRRTRAHARQLTKSRRLSLGVVVATGLVVGEFPEGRNAHPKQTAEHDEAAIIWGCRCRAKRTQVAEALTAHIGNSFPRE